MLLQQVSRDQGYGHGELPPTPITMAPSTPAPTSNCGSPAAGAFDSLRSELAANLPASAAATPAGGGANMEQPLLEARARAVTLERSLALQRALLGAELRAAENALAAESARAAAEVEPLRARCDEQAVLLEEQAEFAMQAQRSARASARQQAAAACAALEEQVSELQDEIARRDAMVDEYGAESERLEVQAERGVGGEGRAARAAARHHQDGARRGAAPARAQAAAGELARRRGGGGAGGGGGEGGAGGGGAAADGGATRAALRGVQPAGGGGRRAAHKGRARAGGARDGREGGGALVDRQLRREYRAARRAASADGELVDFSEGDLLRCGLLDEPPPPVDVGPDAGITEQFAAFLDREGHSGDSPSHSPSASRPGSRRGSFS